MADRDPVPQFLIESNWADFFHGFSLPFWALGVIFRSKKLLALCLIAALLSIVVLGAVAFFVLRDTGPVVYLLGVRPSSHGCARGGYYLVACITVLVLLVVGSNTAP